MWRLLVFCISAIFFNQIRPIQCHAYNPDGWKAAADYLLEAIDMTANPCKDFYKFACGKWQKSYGVIYSAESQNSARMVIDHLKSAIASIDLVNPKTPAYQKALKRLYNQCTNAQEARSDSLVDVYNYTASIIGPMPMLYPDRIERKDPYFLIGQLSNKLDANVLIKVDAKMNEDQCGNVKPHLLLSPPMNLLYGSSGMNEMWRLVNALGIDLNSTMVQQKIDDFVTIRRNFIQGQDLYSHQVDTFRYNELSTELNPNINWEAFFSGLLPEQIFNEWKGQNHQILFKSSSYFRNLHLFIDQLGYEKLLDYAFINILASTDLESGMVTGESESACLKYVMKQASGASTRVFFDAIGVTHDPNLIRNWKRDIHMMSESIFSAARYMIHTSEWLDLEDKMAVIDKINSITFFSGIPEWVLNDTLVLLHTPQYDPELSWFENDKRQSQRKTEAMAPMLISPTENLFEMGDPDFEDNAHYMAKQIFFDLGQVLPPLFNFTYPFVLKYGIVGWAFGHELFHGFDFEGTTDRESRGDVVKRWLKPDAMKQFNKRVQCLLKEYSGFCYNDRNFCVSGRSSINDNIADIEATKVAYMAYKFLTQTMGEEHPLPGLERFSMDQLFFLSVARYWCSDDLPNRGLAREGLYKAAHAPPRARIEIPMINFPAFAQAFNCPVGKKFAPLKTCTLWGDFMEPKRRQRT